MVKYHNLDYRQQNHLNKLYVEKFPKPDEPQRTDEKALIPASKVIRCNGEARLYVEPNDVTGRRVDGHECDVRLVLLIGRENHRADLTVDELSVLIEELVKVRDAAQAVNTERRAYYGRQDAWRKACEAWEAAKEKHLRQLLAPGKITAEMIDEADKLDDLGSQKAG